MPTTVDTPASSTPRSRGRSRRRRRSINSVQRRRRRMFCEGRNDSDDDYDDSSSSSSSSESDESASTSPDHHCRHSRHKNNKNNKNGTNQRIPRRRRKSEPLAVIFVKVGLVLWLSLVVSYATFFRARSFYGNRWEDRASLREDRLIPVVPANQPSPKSRWGTPFLRKNNQKKDEITSATDFDAPLAEMDAYGIAATYYAKDDPIVPSQTHAYHDDSSRAKFTALAAQRRAQFASLVGGEQQARATLQRSLVSLAAPPTKPPEPPPPVEENTHHHRFPGLVHRLRELLQQQQQQQQEQPTKSPVFSVVVLGSSAAAGSGNYYEQSYAFVLERLLAPLFQAYHVDFRVTNGALEDTSEFPSLWCWRSRTSSSSSSSPHNIIPDMVVWDYGLTSRPEGWEAFLRQVASWNDPPPGRRAPFVVVRDTKVPHHHNNARNEILQWYVDHQVLMDPLLVHIDQAVAPYLAKSRHSVDHHNNNNNNNHNNDNPAADTIPEGFREWTTSFGGPPGAPGKEHTHLTVKQHLMTGWLITMHMLSALEWAVLPNPSPEEDTVPRPTNESVRQQEQSNALMLPPPMTIQSTKKARWTFDHHEELIDRTSPAWLTLLMGEPVQQLETSPTKDDSEGADRHGYTAPRGLQCRTSYITPNAPDSLDELIISGPVEGLWDVDSLAEKRLEQVEGLLLPKGKQFFTEGWVPDLDKATKRKKQLSKKWNFLGFQDMIKKSYYGLHSSGDLTLFISLSPAQSRQATSAGRKTGIMPARDYIETVLICEADVPRSILPSDADRDEDGACRLHKDTFVHVGGTKAFLEVIPSGVSSSCVFINVPESANLFSKQEFINQVTSGKLDVARHQGKDTEEDEATMGLPIRIRVRGDRGDMKVPCSVAHVLWNEVGEKDSAV